MKEGQNPRNKVKEPQNLVCGIDVGLKSFATMVIHKRVIKIEYPKHPIKAKKRLKRLQRALARKQKCSQDWEKNTIQIMDSLWSTFLRYLEYEAK